MNRIIGNRKHRIAALGLLATTMLGGPVLAQTAESASSVDTMAAELRAMRARIDMLEREVETLRTSKPAPTAETAAAAPPPVAATPADRAAAIAAISSSQGDDAPTFDPNQPGLLIDRGKFPIEIFGQIQYDFAYTSNPDNRIDTFNLGYNGTARRLIFGFRGGLPGDFRYNLEFMLAREIVDYEDVTLSWEPAGKPYSFKIGNHYPFVSLENLTSNKRNSFIERSAANDAFVLNRRIGASFGLVNKAGDLRFNAGVFNGFINNSAANTEYELAARGVWSPKAFGGLVHVAANYQYRRTPAQEKTFLYRARPYTQATNVRFVGTGPATSTGSFSPGIASHGDQIFGVELAGIFGPFHFASEAHYLKVDAIAPGELLGTRSASNGTRLVESPEFAAAYGEVGFWLTGETRGYRFGRFFRTPILKPVGGGGLGGVQLVARVDYLDLQSHVGGSGRGIVDGVLNGGRQLGYQFAVNYWPTDFLRFTGQYSRLDITGGPNAGQVVPVSTLSLLDRSFNVDALVFRAQIEF